MAKRNFNDQIWLDATFSEYTAEEMLVYLYTYYNPRQTLAGVYIWTLKQAACDLPIDKETIKQAMDKFFAEGIFFYDESTHELMVRDWCRYMLNPSPKTYGAVLPVIPQIKSETIRQKVEAEVAYWEQAHIDKMLKKGEKEALKKNIEAHSIEVADRIMGRKKDGSASVYSDCIEIHRFIPGIC